MKNIIIKKLINSLLRVMNIDRTKPVVFVFLGDYSVEIQETNKPSFRYQLK